MSNNAENTHDLDSMENQQLIKATLEQWISEVQKKAELDKKLQTIQQSDKSHIQSLSEL